jgi:hypothetical protein
MKKRIAVGVLLLVTVALLYRFSVFAAEEKKPAADGPWAGKVVAVYTKTSPQTPTMLENVQPKQLAGTQFLVGKHIDDEAHPIQKGRTIWISVDSVVSVMEFENAQDVKRAFEQ